MSPAPRSEVQREGREDLGAHADTFLVRSGANVVGPVTLVQMQRGLDAGLIPESAEARAVGAIHWAPVHDVLTEEGSTTVAVRDDRAGDRGDRSAPEVPAPQPSWSRLSTRPPPAENAKPPVATARPTALLGGWLPHGVAGALGAALLVMVIIYVSATGERDQKIAGLISKANTTRENTVAEQEKTTADLEETRTRLVKAAEDLKKTSAELVDARAEITKLKVTPRYFFDQALELAKKADDDAEDAKAIEAFKVVVDRFPEDALAKASKERMAELKERIEGRARKLKEAQAEVRKLIKKCRDNTKAARGARDGALRFNEFNDLDMNSALAGDRQARELEQGAEKAKEKAGKLLKGDVPDPDGELAKMVEGCDGTG